MPLLWGQRAFLARLFSQARKRKHLGFMEEVSLGKDSPSQCLTLSATMVTPSGASFVVSGSTGNFIHSYLMMKHY